MTTKHQNKPSKKLFTLFTPCETRKCSVACRKFINNISRTSLSAPNGRDIAYASFKINARLNRASHRRKSLQSHTYEHSKGERRANTSLPRHTHQSARTRSTFRQSSGNACARAGTGWHPHSSGSDDSRTARLTAKGHGTSHNTSFLTVS
ncbi:hypothetical protein AC781_03900 [Akkermansia glycaniphila]|nr:hypothetical protein AC781_03900 [Akkermansia glycaniphila]